MNQISTPAIQRTASALFAAALMMSVPAAHAADTCTDFLIKITNNFTNEVKLTKFEYRNFDTKRWEVENAFGVDGETKIDHGVTFKTTRNLQHTGGDNTKFRVTYKKHLGGSSWGDPLTVTTADFTCKNNDSKDIAING